MTGPGYEVSPAAERSPRSAGAATASVRAYDYVKSAIIRGDFAAGTLISEGLVCQQLEVSRTPVHEAFLRLASEDLLHLQSRKGAIVRPMSPSEAEDVLQMREAVESSAAERVVQSGRAPDVVPSLRALLEIQVAAVASGDVDAFLMADDRLHTAVIEASGNRIALHFATLLHDRQQRLRHQLMKVRPAQLELALDEHRELVDALSAGDVGRYASVLRRHVLSHRGAL